MAINKFPFVIAALKSVVTVLLSKYIRSMNDYEKDSLRRVLFFFIMQPNLLM